MLEGVADELGALRGVFRRAFDPQSVVAGELDVAVLLDEVDDAGGVHRGVLAEVQNGHFFGRVDLGDAVALRNQPQTVCVHQRLRRRRQAAEAIDDFLGHAVELGAGGGAGQSLVERKPGMHIAAIVVGQQGGHMQIDLGGHAQRVEQVGLAACAQRLHGLAQHVVVELEADLLHIARLLLAQHFAGAANLQVVHGQIEARAQFFHLLNGFEPLAGLLGQTLHIGHQQIGVGLVMRAPDAAAQLVQLRQAELVGPRHDDGVGAGYVDAGFDNGGAQQNIEALGVEVAHHPFQIALVHLAVGDFDARFGHQFFELATAVFDGLDLVVQEIHLAAALNFAQDGLAHHRAAFAAHEGLDRQPLLRRGGDHAQIAQPFERHAQGARNGCGGEGEQIDRGAHGLERLFVAHAEAVLLIDDDQAEPVELDRGRQQLMGTDDDVHRAARQAVECGADLLGAAKARHLGNAHRPVGEAVAKGLAVLLGEQGGGGEHGHLLAAHHRHERGAQRDFGLAEADVAADQAIHRLGGDHVLHHRMDGRGLIGRLLETETRGEGFIVLRRVAEGMALMRGAAGVDVEQLGGGVAYLFGGFAPGLVPLARAEDVQRRVILRRAAVAADEMQLRHRHVEHRIVRIDQMQKLRGAVAQIELGQALIAADAVVGMHHRVAGLQLGQVVDQGIDIAGLLLLAPPALGRVEGEQLGLGEHGQSVGGQRETPRQRPDGQGEAGGALYEFVPAFRRLGRQAGLLQQLAQGFAAAGGFGQQQRASVLRAALFQPLRQARQWAGGAAVGADVG